MSHNPKKASALGIPFIVLSFLLFFYWTLTPIRFLRTLLFLNLTKVLLSYSSLLVFF